MNHQPDKTAAAGAASETAVSRGIGVRQLALVVAILGATILLTTFTSDVTRTSEAGIRLVNGQPYLPAVLGDWTSAKEEGLTKAEQELLPPDTLGARRRYVDSQGHEVTCSIILAGRDVTSIHRPELCLPGQGWNIQMEQVETIPVTPAAGKTLKVMRMDAKHTVALVAPQRPLTAIFIYWFVGKERVTPHHWERILWTMKDRVLHNRNHRWAYILIASPVRPSAEGGEALARAQAATMEVLTRFVEQLYPVLQPIPNE